MAREGDWRETLSCYNTLPPHIPHNPQDGVAYCSQQAERGIRKHRYDTIAEGIGMDRITSNLGRLNLESGRVGGRKVKEQDIVDVAWWIYRKEGIRVGSSTAVNIMGVMIEGRVGEVCVTVMCSKGKREEGRLWNKVFVEKRGLEWREGWKEGEWKRWVEEIRGRKKREDKEIEEFHVD